MLLHRKNDSRDASSRSLRRYGVFGATVGGLALDPEEELRADAGCCERHLDARLEAASLRAGRDTGERRLQIGVGDRTPIGAARERRDDRLGAALSSAGRRGLADEHAAAARRVARMAGPASAARSGEPQVSSRL